MFSMKENHFAHDGKTERSTIKFFDPWEHKLAFDHDQDRMAPAVSNENRERATATVSDLRFTDRDSSLAGQRTG